MPNSADRTLMLIQLLLVKVLMLVTHLHSQVIQRKL